MALPRTGNRDYAGARVRRFGKRTEWPLVALSVIFLVAYAWPILQSDLGDPWRRVSERRLRGLGHFRCRPGHPARAGQQRLRYFVHHIIDVILVTLPMLRPLRMLRLLTLLRVPNYRAAASLRGKVIIYVVAEGDGVSVGAAQAATSTSPCSHGW